MEQTEDKFSIENVEQKNNELKKKVLELSYKICDRMEEYKTLHADIKDNHYQHTLELQKEQKDLEKQLSVFTKILVSMKKALGSMAGPGLSQIQQTLTRIESSLAPIKQSMKTE